jgi:hypothetical protein
MGIVVFAQSLRAGERPGWEFRGVYVEGGRTLLSLRENDSGETAWVEVGQRVRGFFVKSFDPAREQLTLLGAGGQEIVLRLAAAPVRADQPQILSREAAKAELMARAAKPKNWRRVPPGGATAREGILRTSKSLDELSPAEFDKLMRVLTQAQPLPESTAKSGVPVGWVPLTREALDIEYSFNLTDADIAEIDAEMRRHVDAQLGPLLKQIQEEVRQEYKR